MTKEELINKLKTIQSQVKNNSNLSTCKIRYSTIDGWCKNNFIEDGDGKIVPYIQELAKKSNDNMNKCVDDLYEYINEIIVAISNSEES